MTNKQKSKPVIAGIGELLFDVLENSEELGGAPINFAYHAGALGAEAYAISSVGDDERGHRALMELRQKQLSTRHITVQKAAVTGYVRAIVDAQGMANYSFPDNVAWDHLRLTDQSIALASELDAVCFGSLAQRTSTSREQIHHFLSFLPDNSLKVLDLNLRQKFYNREIIHASLNRANILKLNDEELATLASLEELSGEALSQLRALIDKYQLQLAVLTRGDAGSLLVTATEYCGHKGHQTQVIDTIGAGDSFTATTVLGLLMGLELEEISESANRVAAYVCSKKGAMPTLPEKYRMF